MSYDEKTPLFIPKDLGGIVSRFHKIDTERKSTNINSFGGLYQEWVGLKMFAHALRVHLLVGSREHINKISGESRVISQDNPLKMLFVRFPLLVLLPLT